MELVCLRYHGITILFCIVAAYVHEGITCNGCKHTIVGPRYKCGYVVRQKVVLNDSKYSTSEYKQKGFVS